MPRFTKEERVALDYIDSAFIAQINELCKDKFERHICAITTRPSALVQKIEDFISDKIQEKLEITAVDEGVFYIIGGKEHSLSFYDFCQYMLGVMSQKILSTAFDIGDNVTFMSDTTIRRKNPEILEVVQNERLRESIWEVVKEKEARTLIGNSDEYITIKNEMGVVLHTDPVVLKKTNKRELMEKKKKKMINEYLKHIEGMEAKDVKELEKQRDEYLMKVLNAEKDILLYRNRDYKEVGELWFDNITGAKDIIKEYDIVDKVEAMEGGVIHRITLKKGLPMVDVSSGNRYVSCIQYVIEIDVNPASSKQIVKFSEKGGNTSSIHPHISSSGNHCWGDYLGPLKEAYAAKDVVMIFEMALHYLSEFNIKRAWNTKMSFYIDGKILKKDT